MDPGCQSTLFSSKIYFVHTQGSRVTTEGQPGTIEALSVARNASILPLVQRIMREDGWGLRVPIIALSRKEICWLS